VYEKPTGHVNPQDQGEEKIHPLRKSFSLGSPGRKLKSESGSLS